MHDVATETQLTTEIKAQQANDRDSRSLCQRATVSAVALEACKPE